VLTGSKTYEVRGRVIDADTKQPIGGILIAIGVTNLGFFPVDTMTTGQDGHFHLKYRTDKKIDLKFEINTNDFLIIKHNKCYSSYINRRINNGYINVGDIELQFRC